MSATDRPVLVTGAAGCIGAWVIAALLGDGRPALALDLSADRRRLRLLLDAATAEAVPWVALDITDSEALAAALAEHQPAAIVHLAALQVPFCRADPVAGARVNVVGQVNLFEAARHHGPCRLVYASSVAACPPPGGDRPATLYGVYKAADEGIAGVYWDDWGVPSIGLRPHTVYGPGRDQGLTSAPTKAMLAAAAGRDYDIPFTGELAFQHAADVARVFLAAADAEHAGAGVFDVGGTPVSVDAIVAAIGRAAPGSTIRSSGPALPFPAAADNARLRALIGDWDETPLDAGVARSIEAFRDLLARGLVDADAN